MSSERARELEERGIEAAKAGQKDEARQLLQHALRLNPISDNAWLWLASVAKDKRERLLCLQKVLEINPENDLAIKAVQGMGIDPARLLPQRPSIEDSLIDEGEAAEGGVPVPSADFLRDAIFRVESVMQPYSATPVASKISWMRKTKGRTGEREIWIFRAQIAAAMIVFGAITLGLVLFGIDNSPQVQLVLFGASPSPRPPTATATATLTPRPDINPTVTPTIDFTVNPTFTPTPTQDGDIIAWPLDNNNTPVYATSTPTRIYLGIEDNAISTAVAALESDVDYDNAIERMQFSQQSAGSQFNPYYYYFDALLQLRLDNPRVALERLDAGQAILDDTSDTALVNRENAQRWQPVMNAARMQVYLYEVQNAVVRNNGGLADARIAEMETLTEQTQAIDPTYADPVALLAEAYIARRRFDSALELTQEALEGQLASSLPIVVAQAKAYLERGRDWERRGALNEARTDFAQAQQTAYTGIYINPFSDAAHTIRVEATLELGDTALASVYTNEFLFYRPDSPTAYRLLANVRVAENKPEFALDVFTEALGQEEIGNASLATTYRERAELYLAENRFSLALTDLSEALNLVPSLDTQYLRMIAAYNAGDSETALNDANALIDANYTELDEARLIRSRIWIDEGRTTQYPTALNDLIGIRDSLPTETRHIADEYIARIFLNDGSYGDALNAIDRAIGQVETGSRRYLRAQIYEAQGDRANTIAEYEWLLLWNQIYDYPFAEDVRARLSAIQAIIAEEQAAATATVIAATQAVLDATATVEAENATLTAESPEEGDEG